jgi:spermidine synthase
VRSRRAESIDVNPERPALLDLPSPFVSEAAVLRLLESPDTRRDVLYERIVGGTYDKPYILEDGELRHLCFGLSQTQSVMRLSNPYALDLAYTRQMMAFLLFNCQPRRIVLIGLGGGSIAKYCYRYLPGARLTVVESDPNVIALRDEFLIPRDDFRFSVVHADGAAYLAELRRGVDVLLVDAFDRNGIPSSFGNVEFYTNAHRCLCSAGVFVMNLVGDRTASLAHRDRIREVFAEAAIAVPVEGDSNCLIFAHKHGSLEPRWKWLLWQARRLKELFGLEFPTYVQELKRCYDAELRWDVRRKESARAAVPDRSAVNEPAALESAPWSSTGNM